MERDVGPSQVQSRRVAFLCASLRGGGAERVFVLIANELASRGHDVVLLTWNGDGPNAALLAPAVKLVDLRLPLRGEGFGIPTTLKGLLRTAFLLRRIRFDAVFSAPEFFNLIVTLALQLGRSKARFFPTFHAAKSLAKGRLGSTVAVRLSALVSARTEAAVAVSSGVGRELEARGFPPSKIAVIHNPVPAAAPKLRSYPWHRDLIALGDGPVIVTAGRLVPVKDHATLLRAFAQLCANRPARLVIFGEGPMQDDLRAIADEAGIKERVLFPGYVNDPGACYAVADLFVLSSKSEGFGNVLVEAMAAGVPVVSTDAPFGPREILDHGRFGTLVPVGDVAALAAAMAAMLDDPTPAALLLARATDFDPVRIGDRYEALLPPTRPSGAGSRGMIEPDDGFSANS